MSRQGDDCIGERIMADSQLDNFDRRILNHLQKNGDLGPSDLSSLVYLSPSQCSRRLQRLKNENYIDRIVALLNPERLNLGVSAYVTVKLRSHARENEDRFRERVQSLSEVTSCEGMTGEADYMLKVFTRDLESYNRFLATKIHTAKEIDTARSSIILENLKSTTELSLDFC
jgi:DNA-binding Lrp family transcriptional regulator